MSNTPMRDSHEAAQQSAVEARSARRDQLAAQFPVGLAVTHAYTGDWRGRVVRAYLTRTGKPQVRVHWGDRIGEKVHAADLVRPFDPPLT